MPARHPRPGATVALRPVASRAAPRRPVHHRGGGDVARQPRKAARYRRDAALKFRADAGEIPRGAKRDAGARAEAETQARLSPPQTRLKPAFSSEAGTCLREVDPSNGDEGLGSEF